MQQKNGPTVLCLMVVVLYPKGNSNSRKKEHLGLLRRMYQSFVFYRAFGYICGLITIPTAMSDRRNTLNANAFLNSLQASLTRPQQPYHSWKIENAFFFARISSAFYFKNIFTVCGKSLKSLIFNFCEDSEQYYIST